MRLGSAGDPLRWYISQPADPNRIDRKSTRLNSSHSQISYAVFCLKKKKKKNLSLIYTSDTNLLLQLHSLWHSFNHILSISICLTSLLIHILYQSRLIPDTLTPSHY